MNFIKSLFSKPNTPSMETNTETAKVNFVSETVITPVDDTTVEEQFPANVENSEEFNMANKEYLYTAPEISGWFSEEEQLLAFQTLLNFYSVQHSILDIGCGRGDLLNLLLKVNPNISYTGIDYNPNLISLAKEKFPSGQFEVAEFPAVQYTPESFDWVFASAIFNQINDRNDQFTYAKQCIDKMFELCKLGVAFNLMYKAPDVSKEELDTLYVHDIGEWCKYLTDTYSKTCMYCDYINGDVTFFISK